MEADRQGDGAGAPMPRRPIRPAAAGRIEPAADQRSVIDHGSGRLRVLAGPGTGKTATIVEAVAERIELRRVPAPAILVLTFSRRAAGELAQRIAARLQITVVEPIVRTVHSYAYGIVRAAAQRLGDPPPRLLEAGQADLMVRDLLAGHAEDGGGLWPADLHAALRVPAFAAELRELMLRCAEQGITPRRIATLARRLGRLEWEAVAAFIDEYRDVSDLRSGTARLGAALDQAELTVAALDRLSDPVTLAAEQARIRRIFVDEYQDVDPAQARLIDLVGAAADEVVLVGDPDQAIYAFRGAAPGALERAEVDAQVALTTSRRMLPALVTATRRVAARLPGSQAHRQLVGAGVIYDEGSVEVRILSRRGQEAAYVADSLRRAHVIDGVPWSQMAVLLRSPLADGEVFRRALAAVGVPVAAGPTGPLATQPLVAALLTILRAGVRPDSLHGGAAAGLLTSPIGGMDPLSLRRLRRAVRASVAGGEPSSTAMIAEIMLGRRELPSGVAEDLAAPLRRMMTLFRIAADGAEEPAAETVLWQVWQAAQLVDHLEAASLRGGPDGARADAHLDAVVDLFGRAADLAAQLPSAGARGLLELLGDETIPAPESRTAGTEAVSVLSAHSAKGLEWDVVAVAAVQDDTWPDLRPRATLLRMTELIDAASGIATAIPAPAALSEERRLFYVAATRARRRLLVTAVEDEESIPSRFLADLLGPEQIARGWPLGRDGAPRRSLTVTALTADLRRALITTPARDSQRAAALTARLAQQRIAGADPGEWYGLAPLSSAEPLVGEGAELRLSPSQLESALQCPLRTVLDRNGGRVDRSQPQLLGIAVHALAEGVAAGADAAAIAAGIEEFLAAQPELPPWEIARTRRRITAMYEALAAWVTAHAADRAFLGSELELDIRVPGDGPHPIRLRGRVDWLSAAVDGRVIVTDFKTGSTLPTKAEAVDHAQLAAYQIAVALGGLDQEIAAGRVELPPGGAEPAGAELVYVAKQSQGRAAERFQPQHSDAVRQQWMERIAGAAESIAGPTLIARAGSYCERCPVRGSCPIQVEGRQVTRR